MSQYVVIYVNTDHQVRESDAVFDTKSEAVEYIEEQDVVDELREDDGLRRSGEYTWTNGVDTWGFDIDRV